MGRVLISQRPEGKAMAGMWEFPGGKVEPGERPEQALIREFQGRARHRRDGGLPRAVDLRQSRISVVPSADATLCVPALERADQAGRRAEGRVGEAERAACLSDAAGGCSAGGASDRRAVIARRWVCPSRRGRTTRESVNNASQQDGKCRGMRAQRWTGAVHDRIFADRIGNCLRNSHRHRRDQHHAEQRFLRPARQSICKPDPGRTGLKRLLLVRVGGKPVR